MLVRLAAVAVLSAASVVGLSGAAQADGEPVCRFTNPPGATTDPSTLQVHLDLQFTYECFPDEIV